MKWRTMKRNEDYICETLGYSSLADIQEFPRYVQIETTATCNSKCSMCPRSRELPKRRTWWMEKDLRKKLLAELALFADHVRRVTPQGYGEPLLDSVIFEFIAGLKNVGIKEVFISSNGSRLNEEQSRALFESGLDQIDFSVDAFTKETYEKIRKGLDYDVMKKNIENFIRIRDEIGAKTRIRFRYVIQECNEHEFDDFCAYWKGQLSPEDTISGKKIHTFGGNVEMPDSEEYNALRRELLTLPCKALFGSLVVLSDGTVPVCGVDVNQEHIAGDANESTLQEIWKGELMAEFRKNHLEHGRAAYPHCPECNSFAPDLKLPDA